jgi:ATP-independent RNA helicase dbpA|nr:DEAD/DEAH box helicase [uncultured Alloprevotella sp.]
MERNIILTNLGFEALTEMQEKAYETIKSGKNTTLLSPTGTGKTLAYLLPIVEKIKVEQNVLQVVIILPSRELALQSNEVFQRMKLKEIRSICLYGGRPTINEHRQIREIKPQLIFATPGRLLDHIEKDNIFTGAVHTLIIDEFDKCLELGFQEDMDKIIRKLPHIKQRIFTSATNIEEIPDFAFPEKRAKESTILNYLTTTENSEAKSELYAIKSPSKDKLETLGRLLSSFRGEPSIVFVAYRESVARILAYLKENKISCVDYHGGQEQEVRERNLYRFRAGSVNVLVATDLAARGLDIPEVRHVVQYHLTNKEEEFIHRSGRTARWDNTGSNYLLIGPEENIPDYIKEYKNLDVSDTTIKAYAPLWSSLYIGRGKKDKLSKGDILGFLCKKGNLKSTEIGRIDITSHQSYVAVKRNKVKQLLQMISGEKIKGMKTLIEPMKH